MASGVARPSKVVGAVGRGGSVWESNIWAKLEWSVIKAKGSIQPDF